MTLFRRFTSLSLSSALLFGSYGFAAPGEPTPPPTIMLQVQGENAEVNDVSIQIKTQPLETDSAAEATKAIAAEVATSNVLTVVSSDDDDTLTQVAQSDALQANRSKLAFVKGSDLAALAARAGDKTQALARDYRGYVSDAIHHDPLGLVILTYGVGSDAFRWIHMSHTSDFVKTSNIAYGVATALVFSVNGKLWSRYTAPIQTKIRKVLKLPMTETGNGINVKDIGVQFLSCWLLSAAINIGRIPLMIEATPANADKITTYIMPFMSSLIGTASGFAWSELYGEMDATTAPHSSRALIWTKNVRNVLLATFASTAMLMNYHQYGIGPWIDIAISGALGMSLYYNSARIKHWLDPKTNPLPTSSAHFCRNVAAD